MGNILHFLFQGNLAGQKELSESNDSLSDTKKTKVGYVISGISLDDNLLVTGGATLNWFEFLSAAV